MQEHPISPVARLGIMAAAVSGNSGALYRLVAGLLDDGIPIEIVLFDVLGATEVAVGKRWQQGDVLISEEHAATATVETVVALLTGSFDQPASGPRFVVAAAEGDDHSLPGRLAAAYMVYQGYRTTYLGGNVQADDLSEYLADEAPDFLLLSCALPNHLLGARSAIRVSHRSGVPVIAGGRGSGDDGIWAHAVGADHWLPSPRYIPEFIGDWSPDIASAEDRSVDPSPDLNRLIGRREAVVAAAQSHLESEIGALQGFRTTSDINHLFGALVASMLVSDPSLLVAELDWQLDTLIAHGVPHVTDLAQSLAVALKPISVEGSDMMAVAMSSGDTKRRD